MLSTFYGDGPRKQVRVAVLTRQEDTMLALTEKKGQCRRLTREAVESPRLFSSSMLLQGVGIALLGPSKEKRVAKGYPY